MSRELARKVAIVTGGGKGQGRASALLFAEEGASVVVADWDVEAAVATTQDITATGGAAIAIAVDVSEEAAVKEMVAATVRTFGRVDILFNNAAVGYSERGRFYMGKLVDTSVEDWDSILGINLRGMALGCKHVLPIMIGQGNGVILNNSSMNALISIPGADAYTAAKGGIVALTRVLADVYGPNGVRVNCVCPGAINTTMIAEVLANPEGPLKYRKANTPLRRVGEPEEIARVALFLVSERSSFITGAILPVDGGYTAR